jgi:hydroxyethylthiazole kinase
MQSIIRGPLLEKVRSERPLIHHITNWVTIYDCANIVRAFGALPVMAHALEEAADMARIADALVLNIGTLTNELVQSMLIAARSANEKGIPVVLDAVGVGATRLRDVKAAEILREVRVDIIKGNASEISRLTGEEVVTRGVEATRVEVDLIETAKRLAAARNATVVITGKEDIVTGSGTVYLVKNGHAMMGIIVGTGCMAASVIGAFAAVERKYPEAAASALACFGIAGELAAARSSGPGSFKSALYDEVYALNGETIRRLANIEER